MKKFKEYLLCVLGALMVAAGVYFFKFPNNFSTGGVSGISIILSGFFHISSASDIMFWINTALLIIGFIVCGKDCGIKTVIGSLTLSLALPVLERVIPLDGPLTDQPLLELLYAVGFPAIGSAILFNTGGSTGGTDIIAMILKKYTQMNIGTALVITDVAITLGSFLFSVRTGLFALLGLLMKSLVVDSIIENINMCKCFQIVTENPKEISAFISDTLKRSATLIPAKGAYTSADKYILLAVMKRSQAVQLRHFIRTNYPESFMIISNSSEIVGKGFRGL